MDYIDHGRELQRFADYRPTAFDCAGLGSEGQEDWRVLPVIQTRDSEALDRSNFRSVVRQIQALDPEEEHHQIHRFDHWGPGWFEIIVVRPTDAMLAYAGELACALADYPVVDESDWSQLESAEAYQAWRDWGFRDFVRGLRSWLHESTTDWMEDATELEQDWVLHWRDAHSGDLFGHGEWRVLGDVERCTRDAWARLLSDLRYMRRAGDWRRPMLSEWRADDKGG